MRIGSGRKRQTESSREDLRPDVPEGGFAPIDGVIEESLVPAAAMPPPPHTANAHGGPQGRFENTGHDLAAAPAVETGNGQRFPSMAPHTEIDSAEIDSSGSGELPAGAPADASLAADDAADDTPGRAHLRDGNGHEKSVIFFGDGDGEGSATPSSWIPDDEADLIMPIEPARLLATEKPPMTSVATQEPWFGSSTPVEPEDLNRGDAAPDGPVFDPDAVRELIVSRLHRSLARPVSRLRAFFGDDATSDAALAPADGGVMVLAGFELEGVIDSLPQRPDGFLGLSVELSPPEPVPLGVRIPIRLVTDTSGGDTAQLSELGDVMITVVGGSLEIALTLDSRVAESVIASISHALSTAAAAANDAVDARDHVFKAITIDPDGSVRIEIEVG